MSKQGSSTSDWLDGGFADLSQVNILIIDDKLVFREVARGAFLGHARTVREATSIDKAVEFLSRFGGGIGCIIVDWELMPLGGLELLRMIRCRTLPAVNPRTPVVIMTGRADAAAVKTAMELDVNGFVVAPLTHDKLTRAVAGALNRTWLLQQPSHYASVPGIVPPPTPAPKAPLKPASKPLAAKPFARRNDSKAGAPLKNVRLCVLEDVHPGSILARDLRDREGHVLAASGTHLNAGLLERLKNVGYALSDSYYVWVGEA